MNLLLLVFTLALTSLSLVPAAVVKDDGLQEEMDQLEALLLDIGDSQDRVKRASGDKGVT